MVLALNPRGQLPAFQDGDVIVNDSVAAILYLEEAYDSGTQLMPADVKAKAKVSVVQLVISDDSAVQAADPLAVCICAFAGKSGRRGEGMEGMGERVISTLIIICCVDSHLIWLGE